MNRHIFSFIMMTALLAAAVSTSCNKDTPEWYTDSQTRFKNGRFVPDVDDVLPGAVLGGNASAKSLALKSAPSSVKAAGDPDPIKFTDLKGNCMGGFERTVQMLVIMRENMDFYKQQVLEIYGNAAPTTMGVWKGGAKYTEDASGKFIYAKYQHLGDVYLKLSMYSDDANEIYYFDEGQGIIQYSYLKGDRFIYISGMIDESMRLISVNTVNGITKGTEIGFATTDGVFTNNAMKLYGMTSYEGDDLNAEIHNKWEDGLANAATGDANLSGRTASAMVNGIAYSFGDVDIRAFANIDEIYFNYYDYYNPDGQNPVMSQIGRVSAIKLTDGTVLDDDSHYDLGYFRLYESAEYRKLDEYAWDAVNTGGIFGEFSMYVDGADLSLPPSAVLPPALSGLQYKAGFDQSYMDLKAKNETYFNNFRITDFAPLANKEFKFSTIQENMNILRDYVQTNKEGF